MEKPKVLVVDDDLVWLALTQAWLQLAGYEVITRASSFGTTAVVEAERPDFILLDVNMPGLGGETLAKVIADRSGEGAPGIVLYSGNEVTETRERARNVGALGAVQKTIDRQQFVAELERCFAARARLPKAR